MIDIYNIRNAIAYWLKFKLMPVAFCGGCGLPGKNPICGDCLSNLKVAECNSCLHQESGFIESKYFAYYYQIPLQNMLIAYKYKRQTNLRWALGYLLKIQINNIKTPIDYIIPVPTHKKKIRKRGFDHILGLLNYYIATGGIIPVNTKCLVKSIYHTSQVKLNKEERMSNLSNTFKVVGNVAEKNILIIDDVHTTGSTLNEVATILKQAGANKIYSLILLKNVFTK